jgi:hypothetical protein
VSLLEIYIKNHVIEKCREIVSDDVIRHVASLCKLAEDDIRRKAIRYRILGVNPSNENVFVSKSSYYACGRSSKLESRFKRDIGLGLFSQKKFKKDNKMIQFIGELIDKNEKERRVKAGLGFFILKCSENKYLDCRIPYELGICLASFANCHRGIKHKSTEQSGKANSRLSVDHPTKDFATVTLVAECNIDECEELLYDYQDEYNLDSSSPVTEIFNSRMKLKLPMSRVTDKWPGRTQGTGFCGMLSIVQAVFREELNALHDVGHAYESDKTNGKILLLQNPRDREFFINKFLSLVPSIDAPHLQYTVAEQITFLTELQPGVELPFKKIQLKDVSWLSTDFVCSAPGMFLPEYKIFLWREMYDDLYNFPGEFQSIGGNFDCSNRFTYHNWKTNIFNASVIHIYHSSKHFYTGDEYDSEFFHTQLDAAVENAIGNLITFFSLGYVKCTCYC